MDYEFTTPPPITEEEALGQVAAMGLDRDAVGGDTLRDQTVADGAAPAEPPAPEPAAAAPPEPPPAEEPVPEGKRKCAGCGEILYATETRCWRCGLETAPPAAQTSAAPGAATYAAVPRLEFNRQAVVRNLPIFWISDADADNTLDPDELAVTWGPGNASLDRYVQNGSFTPEFAAAYALIAQPVSLDGFAAAEKTRRQAVLEELNQGRPTLVRTTLADPRDAALRDEAVAVSRDFTLDANARAFEQLCYEVVALKKERSG
jgi:hypothetical protein